MMPESGYDEIPLEPVRLAGEFGGRTLGSVLGPERPIGSAPSGSYCRGDVVYSRDHAEKRVKPLGKVPASIYCKPFVPGKHPPHDGSTLSDMPDGKKKACIGSESEVELSIHLEGVGAGTAGTRALFRFCSQNRGYLYIVQKVTVVRQMSGDKGLRVIRNTSYESFRLDEYGTAEKVDPHNSWAPLDDYCRLVTNRTVEMELMWKAPILGSGRLNSGFEFYGLSRSEVSASGGDPNPDTDAPTWSSIFLNGVRGFRVYRLNVRGHYAEDHEVDHCKGGGSTAMVSATPGDASEPMNPVDLSSGGAGLVATLGPAEPPGPTPPAGTVGEGTPLTPEEIERRIRAAL